MDELQRLVQSLSNSEKRYFNLSVKRHSSKKVPAYLQLYEFISKAGDQEADYALFRKKYKSKNLAATKEYLMNNLLDSIADFESASDSQLSLLNEMKRIIILEKRGLNKQIRERASKATAKSLEEKHHLLHFQFLFTCTKEVFLEWKYIEELPKAKELLEEYVHYAEMVPLVAKINYLLLILTSVINRGVGKDISFIGELEKIALDPQLKKILDYPFPYNKITYYTSLSLFYWIKGDLEKKFYYLQLCFQQSKEQTPRNDSEYDALTAQIYNYFTSCFSQKKYDILFKEYLWFSQQKHLIKDNSKRQIYFQIKYEFYFKICNHTNYVSYNNKKIPEFEEVLAALGSPIRKIYKVVLFTEIVQYLFKYKNFKDCVRYCYKSMDDCRSDPYDIYLLPIDTIRMVCYVKMKDWDILKQQLPYFKDEHDKEHPYHQAFCQYFEEIIPHKNVNQTALNKLNVQLETLEQQAAYANCFQILNLKEELKT